MADVFIKPKALKEICAVIKKIYPKAIVWAYGSRVGGDAHEGSDLDLVVKDFGQEDSDICKLKKTLKESNVPFLIDISDFNNLPKGFQKEIEKKYVVIYDGCKAWPNRKATFLLTDNRRIYPFYGQLL